MFPLVPERYHALAEARMGLRPGLRRRRPDRRCAGSLARRSGPRLRAFHLAHRSGFWDTAGELMAERSTSAEALGRPPHGPTAAPIWPAT
jgi:soluble lytic murein transglycosylase